MQNRNIINGFSGIEYICSTEYNGIHNHMHYIHVVREKHGIQIKTSHKQDSKCDHAYIRIPVNSIHTCQLKMRYSS